MLLVVLAAPRMDVELVKAVAGVVGLAPAEARQKMSGHMPRVLRMEADSDKLGAMVEPLAGLLVCPLCNWTARK